MARRPLCAACLILMASLYLLDLAGISLVSGNPLPETVQQWIEDDPHQSVQGEVQHCSRTENGTSVILKNSYLIVQSKKTPIYNLRVFLSEEEDILPGTGLLLTGQLAPIPRPRNPGEFDSRQYYACDHIYYFLKKAEIQAKTRSYSVFGRFLQETRSVFSGILSAAAGEDAPVFDAILLGDKAGLDEEQKLRFQMAGILHLLAISGLHISILGMGLFSLLLHCGAGLFPSGLCSLIVMLLYGVMTGGSVSAMRALCMFLMAMGARFSGRVYDLLTALALSAILILLESPAYLYSSSFLLSFGAVLGIGVVSPVLTKAADGPEEVFGRWLVYRIAARGGGRNAVLRLWEGKAGECCRKAAAGIGSAFIGSVSVQLATLPVLLYYYGEVSLGGLWLNLIVLPTAGALVGSGAAAVLLGAGAGIFSAGLGSSLAQVLILPGRLILHLYDALAGINSKLPLGTWIGGRPDLFRMGIYLVALGASLTLLRNAGSGPEQRPAGAGAVTDPRRRRTGSDKKPARQKEIIPVDGKRKRASRTAAAAGILAAGIFVLGFHHTGRLQITCLDVGQGDGIVVRTPQGKAYLIDGGSTSKKSLGKYQLLPYLKSQGIRQLDGVFLSHTDEDHYNGVMELLAMQEKHLSSVRIKKLYLPDWEDPPPVWEELAALARKAGAGVAAVREGDALKSGALLIRALAPVHGSRGEDVNEESMVLQLEYKGFKALFTGDIGETAETLLLPRLENVDFLKVGHHGSQYSSCEAFLQKIRPELGVISCSESNRYGHPSPEAVSRLEEAGCRLFYTMYSGAVSLSTDGDRIKVSRYVD